MGQAVAITRLDHSAAALRRAASRCADARAACRIPAIAHVLDGAARHDAAAACGMGRQTLRDWVHRYDANGIAGLGDAPRSGRPAALSSAQRRELKALVLAGPDPERDGVVRWPLLRSACGHCRALRGQPARADHRQAAAPPAAVAGATAAASPHATGQRSKLKAVGIRLDPTAIDVGVSDTLVRVILADARELAVPLEWFPRLRDATPEQRRHWRLIGRGQGIHWPDLDEDISVRGLLGLPS